MNPILRKINDWSYNKATKKELKAPSPSEQKYIDELRKDLSGISQSFNAISEWEENQKKTISFLMHNDPRKFLSFKVIIDTMFFQGSTRAVKTLVSDTDFGFWKPILKEDPIGLPKPFFKYRESSGNLLQHCISLKQVLNKAAIQTNEIHSVFEFGGGYGSFCRLMHRAGFKGQYVIFDLPVFNILQKYFLSNLNIQASLLSDTEQVKKDVNLINNISNLKNNKSSLASSDLFVALWSLSECPLSLREEIFSIVNQPKYILIGYQHQFDTIDNRNYFKELKQQKSNYTWFDEPIEYLPGNNYLVGILK